MSSQTRDDGRRKDDNETYGGYNRYDLSSLLNKCARRSPHSEQDREVMMWAAWELCRSGFAWNFWDRCEKIALEDLRLESEEADILLVLDRLNELANQKFEPDEGFGLAAAMRAASLLYEVPASHELLTIKRVWSNAAEEGEDVKEIQESFPVPPAHQDFGRRGYQVLDMHTYKGKQYGRDFEHYCVTASRTTSMTDLEQRYRRRLMNQMSTDFEEGQVEPATTPVSEQDDPWDDPRV